MNLPAVLKAIDRWPAEDQLELMQQVWDRLAQAGWEPELSDDQKQELDRRASDLDERPDDILTWEQIVDHVRRRQ